MSKDMYGVWSSTDYVQKLDSGTNFFQGSIIGVLSIMAISAIISLLIRKL